MEDKSAIACYFDAFSKYFVFEGRATRREFWYFFLFNFICMFVLSMISRADGGVLFLIYWLVQLIPNLSVTARRLHDIGKSAWWLIVYIIPLLSVIVLIFCAFGSEKGTNQYGEQIL